LGIYRKMLALEQETRVVRSFMRLSRHALLIALLSLFCGIRSDAAENVVVYYLDKNYVPVTRLDRLDPMSSGLRAILAMYALQVGGGCDRHIGDRDLLCTLSSALGLGTQCSAKHVALVRSWFKKGIPKMTGHGDWAFGQTQKPGVLEGICYNAPDTATFQDIWEIIRITQHDDRVLVDAIDSWLARETTGRYRYQSEYRITTDSVEIVSHMKVIIGKQSEQ